MIYDKRNQDKEGKALKLRVRGYTPAVAGRPVSSIVEVPLAEVLTLSLHRNGLQYHPTRSVGEAVAQGDPVAEAEYIGCRLSLPTPAAGKVASVSSDSGTLSIHVNEPSANGGDRSHAGLESYKPQYAEPSTIREALQRQGLWPFFWSNQTGSMPAPDGSEIPQSIIVSFVVAEPFRTRGKVILRELWEDVVSGIRFLQRLVADYGKIEITVTEVHDPIARRMYSELSGHVWARLHSVPITYPVEDPRVLIHALAKKKDTLDRKAVIWSINAQETAQVGALLQAGRPLSRRIVAVGGPGAGKPSHVSAVVGSPLSELISVTDVGERSLLLRGGLIRGTPVDEPAESLGYDDDALFCLPRAKRRELLSFVRPGFKRRSLKPAFAGSALSQRDSHIDTTLRGERRPCVTCGMCEQVCPVDLMPQLIHRYLYREMPEEAEKAGLSRCIDCNLCTFVCPSKIELQKQFAAAREQLAADRSEVEAQ